MLEFKINISQDELCALVKGQKIRKEKWFDSLPVDLKEMLLRLMEAQKGITLQ